MSPWERKLDDTVKMRACRQIALAKANSVLATLYYIHEKAMHYASPESILKYCTLCKLPVQGEEELAALKEPEDDEPSTDEGSLSSLEDVADEGNDSFIQFTTEDEDLDYIDPLDLQAGIVTTDCASKVDYESDEATEDLSTNTKEDDSSSTNNWLTNTPGAPYDGEKAITSSSSSTDDGGDISWLTNVPGAPYNVEKAASSSDGDDTTSEPFELEVAVSQNDADDVTHVNDAGEEDYESSTEEWDDTDSSWNPSESVTASDDSAPGFRVSSLSHPLKEYWPNQFRTSLDQLCLRGIKEEQPVVNSSHLLRLRLHINDVLHFCNCIQRNLEILNAESLRRNGLRYDLPHDSPLRFRHHGLGSALRYVIDIDQDWGDEDNWGVPPPKKSRKRI